MDILRKAREVIATEISSLVRVKGRLGQNFVRAVRLCRQSRGKVIMTGIGKSGIIAQKIAATMASTGTLAVYLHPAEGLHGDLGIIQRHDVVIALGKSGESEELVSLIPVVRRIGAKLVAIVGDPQSALARNADVVIDASVKKEACHLNLAPTSSTTVALAIGDALAVVLSELRGFNEDDFALFHPGGTLGKRLILKVGDLMHAGKHNPVVRENASIDRILIAMTRDAMGAVNVVDAGRRLVGIITDGDLRRTLQQHQQRLFGLRARDIMTQRPITVTPQAFAYDALKLMEARKRQIKELPVVDGAGRAVGMVRLHDLVRVGL
jgi:arabinose-5-phosphate isomerase